MYLKHGLTWKRQQRKKALQDFANGVWPAFAGIASALFVYTLLLSWAYTHSVDIYVSRLLNQ